MKRIAFILLRNPLSLMGLILVALVVLAALLADFITPFPADVGAVYIAPNITFDFTEVSQ